ncbi:VPLPA-CTERM sorting domain-containing protein [Rhodobacter sp. CZR27]|uniref:VPLPA-CTERM sorting domain-containing protein n=1 Tax=Rhodobacter sp. CZR27 TaxID=2033869 RepID=UPI0012FE789C|nr:VPLPA-CTERM sorting domain-containing protein [Rhodobacter sp. CZR27]
MIGKFFKSAAICLALASGSAASQRAQAATMSFVVDRTNSSVSLASTDRLCVLSNCGVTASLASSLRNGNSYEIGTGDSATFDFLTLTGRGLGWADYTISAVLAFSSPRLTVSGTGSLFTTTAFGRIVDGSLIWDAIAPIVVNGSEFLISFGSGSELFDDGSRRITTTATLTGVNVVPLPATGLLLVAALGSLALIRRRRMLGA